MTPHDPEKSSRASRIAAFALSSILAALGVYSWRSGVGDRRMFWMLGIGSVLGMLYAIRGGSLPDAVYWLAGDKITTDEDPSNLPPKLYLAILLGVVLIAAIICYVYYPRR